MANRLDPDTKKVSWEDLVKHSITLLSLPLVNHLYGYPYYISILYRKDSEIQWFDRPGETQFSQQCW